MIVTKLQGGLGNQMFQYAAAYANSDQIYLDLDFLHHHQTSNKTFTRRYYELSLFPNLLYETVSRYQKKIFFSKSLFYKLLRKLIGTDVIIQQENELVSFSAEKHYVYLDGYFQSEHYFAHARERILHAFSFPRLDPINQVLIDEISSHENSVSLHIRRGDYLKPEVIKYHGLLSLFYYHEALQLLQRQFRDIKIFIFSDDPAFARENFGHFSYVTIVEGNEKDAWKDMALMAACRHHIIANSSFSWWGAWLSTKQGVKIAPKRWFNPEVASFDISDIIPKNWLTI
ncbi:alpha-1,2-fucosyltransferase [Sphingobacterium sp. DN00404]|uniref:Alpha-1,2-fucosyltransferase n=1 Tax=Sphingobacterium micropteri TaxID=2763501 RepID=A0ABR7YR45_9SPHI|nr:alpha-1,2-fucosyltransferase [Sphingobacterium micropteri]MBD1433818.1 alpha-1,2-fucosyltransferase [Sphingobacterium micropteri]